MIRLTLLTVLSVFLSVSSVAQPRRAMTPADILRVANVTDAQISPNGQWIVYTVSAVDDDDKNTSTLWLMRTNAEPVIVPVTPIPPPQRRTAPYVDWPEIRSTPKLL